MLIDNYIKIGKPQIFTVEDKKIPGLNDMINSAKLALVTSKKNKRLAILTAYEPLRKKWIKKIEEEIISSGINPVEKIYLSLEWEEPTRRRDPDNVAAFIKFILDALRKTDIIKNDGWEQVKGWDNSFLLSKRRAVTVKVWEVEKNNE